MSKTCSKKKELLGIIVGGGPAPGINGIISAATIEAINNGKEVVGIVGGFKGLSDRTMKVMPLTIEDVSRIHASGGSILRTSRDTPKHAKAKFNTLIDSLNKTGIKYLITIGGDGTLYMANWIEREARCSISVAHTPKTIDNDIPLPGGFPTFGYQSARHVGVGIVSNIIEDARSTGRWYFITTMGRHAGHLALGIGEASGATLTVVPEEFGEGPASFKKVADILTGAILKRLAMGKDYGVVVLAEGISERFDLSELAKYVDVKKNEKGELKLPEILLGSLLKDFVGKTLRSMGIEVSIMGKNIGYELRAAAPIPFDVEYVRKLGYGAVRYLLEGGSGSMMALSDGDIKAIPFVEMIDHESGKAKIRKLDISSGSYEAARKYMIQLEREDFSGERLKKLAKVANMKREEFKKRFMYVCD